MASKKPITLDDLWQMERLGMPSLSPDGAHAVLTVSRHQMADNSAHSALWLLSTLGGAPRQLTQCGDKDGQPQFSPRGDRVGFVAKREQQGHKDTVSQFYAIPVDGGEAQRIGDVATGIDAFRWCPDGEHIVFVSWVWSGLKGAKAQAKAMQAHQARKITGVATSAGLYRYWDHMLPEGRVPHLHRMNLRSGKVQDLFEGSDYSLDWCEPDAHCFDISPDGKRLVFAFDPSPERRTDGRFALAPTAHASPAWPATRPCATPCRASWRCSRRVSRWRWSAPNGTTRWLPHCCGRTTAARCCWPPNNKASATSGALIWPTGAPRCWCRVARCKALTNAPARW